MAELEKGVSLSQHVLFGVLIPFSLLAKGDIDLDRTFSLRGLEVADFARPADAIGNTVLTDAAERLSAGEG